MHENWETREKLAVVIVAAGQSTRMGQAKQWISLAGIPVIGHTLCAMEQTPCVEAIVAVVRGVDVLPVQKLCRQLGITKITAVVEGGDTRQQSVAAGVAVLPPEYGYVAIHDGARPFASADLTERVFHRAAQTGAAAAAVRVKDTIKIADEQGWVQRTPDRRTLWSVQTPQIFRRDLYEDALQAAGKQGWDVTDDCQLMERAGHPVALCEGDYRNIKITTPEDIPAARALLKKGEEAAMRIGHGYDVHRLVAGRKLILGGMEIPYEKGLLGHSDADVLLHAIADALLGAAALGDIGGWFPDTDERYRDADSGFLLQQVVDMVKKKGYRIGNIDATVLAQEPKLKPYIPNMREKIAALCGLQEQQVNLKATTEEELGFTGRKEGIAAHAVCLLFPAE